MNTRLKKIRESLELTQEEFAQRLNTTSVTISNWEGGKRPIPEEKQVYICSVLKVNRKWLETGEGEMMLEKQDPLNALSEISLLVELARRSVDRLDEKTKEIITTFVTELAAKLSDTDGKDK